jgi:hypothetical protein
MKKNLFIAFILLTGRLLSQGSIGIDIGQPIDPSTGTINPGTDTAIVGATCTPWVRVNFILGPWSGPGDQTLYNGKTWQQAYDAIINALVAKGIQVYGLIGAEAYSYPGGTLEHYPGADSAASVAWIQGYTQNFVQIVDMFKDRVRVFESYNEPNNWTNSNTAIVDPAWFALMLQEIYLNTKLFNGHGGDPAWQVTLVSGALFTFDANSGGQYINDTYWYGKNVFAWDWTHQNAGAYPLDGFGQHLYVAQGDSDVNTINGAMTNNLNDFWNNIYTYEDDPNKKIWVSEFGWESNVYGESFQAQNLTTGFNLLQADVRVALSLWFTLSDFPGGNWGIYYMGSYLPSDQKQSYAAFKNRNSCAFTTGISTKKKNELFRIITPTDGVYLQCDLSLARKLNLSLIDASGKEVKAFSAEAISGKSNVRIETAGLSRGIYLLRINNLQTLKFVLD